MPVLSVMLRNRDASHLKVLEHSKITIDSVFYKKIKQRSTLLERNFPLEEREREKSDIPTMNWPPQSPDINIIENVWRTRNIKLQTRVNGIRSKQDLMDNVYDIWTVPHSNLCKVPLHVIEFTSRQIIAVPES